MRLIAIISMFVAGLIHFWVIPGHISHAVPHAIAYLIIGILQVAWAAAFWINPSKKLAKWGLYLAVGSIVLWIMTRILPAPFAQSPKSLIEGINAKTAEAIAAIAIIFYAKAKNAFSIIKSIIIALIIGIIVYAAAKVSEPFFPMWIESHTNGHQQRDNHQDSGGHQQEHSQAPTKNMPEYY